jgi:hypothetical protein
MKVATAFWDMSLCRVRDILDYFGGTSANIFQSTQHHIPENNNL